MVIRLLSILSLMFWAISAPAAPVIWTFNNATFQDGGVITGSFVFDNGAVTSFNFSVSGGDETTFPPFNYIPASVQEVASFFTNTPIQPIRFSVDPAAPTGSPASRSLSIVTDGPLTNAGGIVNLQPTVIENGTIWPALECFNCNPVRNMIGGALIGVPVAPPPPPPPSTILPGGVQLYGTATGFGTGEQGSGGSGGGTGPGQFSQFLRVDIETGATFEVSSDIGYGGDVGGLAADASNRLFAGTGGRGPNNQGRGQSPTLLFTIDPVTGLGNPEIGPLGLEFGPPQSAGQGPGAGDFDQFGSLRQNISGWSFDPISGQLYGMAGRGSQLFTADTATGLATRVGTPCDSPQIGMPGGFCRRGNALAFDDVGVHNPRGTLFWANDVEIAELDPTTGLIVGDPVALDYSIFGLPTDPDAGFRVVAMDYHPLTGDLYAAVQQRQSRDSPPAKSTLAILDPNAGTFTIVGEIDGTGVKLDGIAFTTEVIFFGTATGFGTGGGGGGPGGPGSGTGQGNASEFYRIDVHTGVTTEISPDIGYGGDVGGLAADSGNQLFAGTGGRGPNQAGRPQSPTLLFTIDPVSGLGNPEIGPLGIEFGPPESEGQGPGEGNFEQFGNNRRMNISGWSFDPLSGQLYGMTGRGSQLFIADTATGLATRVGTPCDSPQIGSPGGRCARGNAIAFDDVGAHNPLGTLFWANDVQIAELDPDTGLITGFPVLLDFGPFGPFSGSAPFRVVALDFHPVTGDLYAAVQQGQPEDNPPPVSTIAILDPDSGIFTIVGQVDSTGVKLDGIAFLPPPSRNGPPVANAGPDQLLECASPGGTTATLDGGGSGDPDSDTLGFLWSAAGILFDDATSQTPSAVFPKGSTTVTLTVSDGQLEDSDQVVVTVADTTPPEIGAALDPGLLWPPNHKMAEINATVEVTDVCDASPTWTLESLTSSEPDNGKGDGNTVNDIRNAQIGTADAQFDLRAERSTKGDGRTYTVEFGARDADGNTASTSRTVVVPHDQGG